MSHMDFSPRNIILDADDKICLIDWGQAGAYPVHFERAGFMLQTEFLDFTNRILANISEYKEEAKDMFNAMYGLTTGACM